MISCSAYPQLLQAALLRSAAWPGWAATAEKNRNGSQSVPRVRLVWGALHCLPYCPSAHRPALEQQPYPSLRHENVATVQVLPGKSLNFLPAFHPFGCIQSPFLVWFFLWVFFCLVGFFSGLLFCFALLSSVCDTENKEEVCKNLSRRCILYAMFIP